MADGGGGPWLQWYGPSAGMVLVQLFSALVDVALKTAGRLGMRPIVFVTYRQGIAAATLLLASLAARGCTLRPMAVGARAFALVFAVSLASTTGQYFYLQGLLLASPSMARATTNLAPGITFAIAAVIGLEKVDIRSLRSVAKVVGTAICLAGAVFMAFFKGPKLLGVVLVSATGDWVKGGIYLVGNAVCVSICYILQVPICKSYLDPLSLATWMCFLATLQCAAMAFFLEPNYLQIWKLNSFWEFPCILYGGVFGSGINFFLQSWCISVKGPLYSAIFTPLSAVITTILSTLFLHEELHIGSILGAITIIVGLYVVLWGKADDVKRESPAINSSGSKGGVDSDSIGVRVQSQTNLSEPLLSDNGNSSTHTC
ncbi:WAT1-related protein At4g28040-like [Panicum virgatum]|uniref:WAT1-related protein At4g28040-like n=1 Tax=Panicum virgatum TaxID=38727 RepID=UPI0019D54DEF|nr:WAT1-related protein At4g28040-like [Panicum virgatum]